jgi:hypothetical protein
MVLDTWSNGGDKVEVSWHRREDGSDEPHQWSDKRKLMLQPNRRPPSPR